MYPVTAITYRGLSPGDVHLIATIDRSEIIDGRYAIVDGEMTLSHMHHVVTGWYPSEVTDHVGRLQKTLAGGGPCHRGMARVGPVGLAALIAAGVGGDPSVMPLEPLHVSAPYRNRGIGNALVAMVTVAARSRGATSLSISSIPTPSAVGAYRRMGAVMRTPPDPVLFAQEPEDIHLILAIEPFLEREATRRRI